MENLPFSFPSPWKGSAGWSAPNLPVLGSLLPSPCAPDGGWLQRHLAMAQPGEPGQWRCLHMALCACRGRAGDAGLGTASITGDKGGDVQVLLSWMCSSLPPSSWFEGLPWGLAWFPETNLLCLPHPHFPETNSAEIHFALSPARSFFCFSLVQTAQKHQAAGLPGTPKESPGAPQESPPLLSPPSFC